MDLSTSLTYSIAAKIPALSYPYFHMDENPQATMKTGCLSWFSCSFSSKLKLRTRKNQLLTSENPSFEHLRELAKFVFLFPREAFDFQSWDTLNFSTGYIHSKIINDFDKNIFHC